MSRSGGDGGPSGGLVRDGRSGGGGVFAGIGEIVGDYAGVGLVKSEAPSVFGKGNRGGEGAGGGGEFKIAIFGVGKIGRGGGEKEAVAKRTVGLDINRVLNRGELAESSGGDIFYGKGGAAGDADVEAGGLVDVVLDFLGVGKFNRGENAGDEVGAEE